MPLLPPLMGRGYLHHHLVPGVPPPPLVPGVPPPPLVPGAHLLVTPHHYNKRGQLVTIRQMYTYYIMIGQINNALFYSPAELNGIAHATDIEKTSIILHKSFKSHMTNPKMHNTRYVFSNLQSWFSFIFPYKREDRENKLSFQTHHTTST